MSNKAFNNYPHALEFVRDCFKTEKLCNKAADTYPSTIQFVSEYNKTHEMCDISVNTSSFIFNSVLG